MMCTTQQWQIVDQHGDVVVTADTVTAVARAQRKTPRAVAERDANLMVNVDAGDEPVFAVPLGEPRARLTAEQERVAKMLNPYW